MREHKFRAWLPTVNKMTYAHTLDEILGWNAQQPGNLIWLQYTGLKDKKAVEIYENDYCVQVFNGKRQEGIVRFSPTHRVIWLTLTQFGPMTLK